MQRADLRDADLLETLLQDADMVGAYCKGANFFMADLRGANCREANLQQVDLQGGDLRKADMTNAHVQDAKLAGADLSGTLLNAADFLDALGLTNAQTREAVTDEKTRLPDYLGDEP